MCGRAPANGPPASCSAQHQQHNEDRVRLAEHVGEGQLCVTALASWRQPAIHPRIAELWFQVPTQVNCWRVG